MGGKDSKPAQQEPKAKPNCEKRKKRQEEEEKQIERFGQETAPHLMVIEFCGGCGFYRFAASTAEKVEQNYPGQFYVELRPDQDQTGRLEITVFINQEDKQIIEIDKGTNVHSKDGGHDIPYKDWDGFFSRVDKAILEANRQ